MSVIPAISVQYNLKPHNTMGVEAIARFFCTVNTVEELQLAFEFVQEHSLKWLMLGEGSNVLFVNNFDGLVMLNRIKGIKIVGEHEEYVYLQAGAGENWHNLVLYSLERGWNGLENLSLIPGTVGAAPIQNIGAYGVELKNVFESLEVFEIETGEMHVLGEYDCKFGYRDSIFKNEYKGRYIITSVTLRLNKTSQMQTTYGAIQDMLHEKGILEPTASDVSKAVIEIRQKKLPDPKVIGNSGSFFKNPVIPKLQYESLKVLYPEIPGYPVSDLEIKVPAGWLIEQSGWKGKRMGNVGVHEHQALVIVNYGTASGSEIIALANTIQESVKLKFSISLTPEVNIIN